MFRKGAYVIHGTNGVCRVDDIAEAEALLSRLKDLD